ncbi:MAG TPA: glycosyltransferase family 2 protein [Solirubrobacteraceae bacterium]|nr:glycosyltransferase family 2 protein [Solirubrobacteraceae bacterium]
MTRPSVSVVMPFGGDGAAAEVAIAVLQQLVTAPGDELILVDNSGSAPGGATGVAVVRAAGEQSPAHARNAGAAAARGEWLLFLDADCEAPADLLERYFAPVPAPEVGALAGEIVPAPGAQTLAARYAAARNFLSARAHFAHPYLPRAAAANLLVRRGAFEALSGFVEGIRAAEDTDFCWRLQRAGWRLELREGAAVAHHYRTTLRALSRQWRGYAAGRAWLARRYPDFHPQPALARVIDRRLHRRASPAAEAGRRDHIRTAEPWFGLIDAWLALQELIGFTQSNRARRP